MCGSVTFQAYNDYLVLLDCVLKSCMCIHPTARKVNNITHTQTHIENATDSQWCNALSFSSTFVFRERGL